LEVYVSKSLLIYNMKKKGDFIVDVNFKPLKMFSLMLEKA
jgi:hypothetical protein